MAFHRAGGGKNQTPAATFTADGVAAAVRAIQQQIKYREFCER
jgi:hypothetical protein